MGKTTARPRHVAIIMDGNGRWARKRALPRTAGHLKARTRVREIIKYMGEQGYECLTLWGFSKENWRRPKSEVTFLFDTFLKSIESEIEQMHRDNVRFSVIGDRSQFDEKLTAVIDAAEALTAGNTGIQVQIAFNYGGTWDMTQAVNRAIQAKGVSGGADAALTEADIAGFLSTAHLPPVDLLIRTGGVSRLSNFMMWQLCYAELYFTEMKFPDFDVEALSVALSWFSKVERRFGRTSEQLASESEVADA